VPELAPAPDAGRSPTAGDLSRLLLPCCLSLSFPKNFPSKSDIVQRRQTSHDDDDWSGNAAQLAVHVVRILSVGLATRAQGVKRASVGGHTSTLFSQPLLSPLPLSRTGHQSAPRCWTLVAWRNRCLLLLAVNTSGPAARPAGRPSGRAGGRAGSWAVRSRFTHAPRARRHGPAKAYRQTEGHGTASRAHTRPSTVATRAITG